MNLKDFFADKTIKPKEKTELLSHAILNREISVNFLIDFAKSSKDPVKASCIEAMEYATQKQQNLIDEDAFNFIVEQLSANAPRIKWESAKVIGNTASLHQNNLKVAIAGLIENSSNEGTVVRWSAAFALGEILLLNEETKQQLLNQLKSICEKEEKNSIQKIYQKAIKIAEK